LNGTETKERPEADDSDEEDSIQGRYLWITTPSWSKSKVFYETAGSGRRAVLFLHTAGADCRQFHALMNDRDLQQTCRMFAFDLPGYGRSDPGSK
jgi:pimeloyl-ACP methyl ester carboxylesterase